MSTVKTQLEVQREKYMVWLSRQQAAGKPLAGYATPCCSTLHHTPYPAPGERAWDTLFTCMGCGEMFMKIVHSDKRVQLLRPELP